jgi:hypothetical protein
LPNSASASSNSSTALAASAASNIASSAFSVSPIYFDTVFARSTWNRADPSSRAMIWAAIVLPVPLGPAKRAAIP